MSSDRSTLLSTTAREVPFDLVAVVAVVAVGWLTLLVSIPAGNPLVVPIALLFVLVAPGYAIVAALFPARRAAETADGHRLDVRGLDFPERLALGVGTSIVVAPFVAFSLHSSVVGVARGPVVMLLGLVTLTAAAAAILRWRSLPPELRFQLSVSPLRAGTSVDRLLVVVVAIVVVVAVSSVGYATTTSRGGEDLTELYVLAVQDDGTIRAENYPGILVLGEPTELYVGLDNHRGAEARFTVVGVVQSVDLDTGAVLRQEEFQRYTATVADGESWGVRHEFTPVWTGVNVRVVYLLYVDTAPSVVSRETAEQSVHIWMDVVDPLTVEGGPLVDGGASDDSTDGPAENTNETDTGATTGNETASGGESGSTNESATAVGATASA